METQTLSARQLRRAMNFLIAAVPTWSVFGAASTGSLLIGMLLSIGMTNEEIGWVMALTLLFLPMQIVGSIIQMRFFHRKRFWIGFAFLHYTAFLIISLLVLFWNDLPPSSAVLIFMILFAVAQAAAQLTGAVSLAWQGELIPPRESNTFWTRRTGILMISTMLAGILLGYIADRLGREKNSTYAMILGGAVMFGYLSLFLQTQAPDPNPNSEGRIELRKMIHEIFRERNFRRLTVFFSVQSFGNWIMCSFIFVYLQKTMNFSQATIQILLASSYITSFLSGYLFTTLGNRFGRKPLLVICTTLKFCEFMLWGTLLPGDIWMDSTIRNMIHGIGLSTHWIPAGFLSTLPVLILGGFVNMGLISGQLSLLTSFGKKNTQSFLIGFFFTLVGLAGALSASASGALYTWTANSPLPELTQLHPFNLLAIAGGLVFAASLFFVIRFHEPGAAPAVTVVRTLLNHNPFRSIYHAHILNLPMNELQRADTLRNARGGLVENQLLLGLQSPSGVVRESVLENISVREEPPEPELEEELIRLLGVPKLAMRQNAAYLLGKHRCVKALPVLISGFASNSPDFAAACIFAAGRIGSKDAVKPLRELLADRAQIELWSIAAEALSRIGGYEHAELIFSAYENENDWILSRQSLVSLCRTVTKPGAGIQKFFEGETAQPGTQIELLLKQLPHHDLREIELLMERFERGDAAGSLTTILLSELEKISIPITSPDDLFLSGTDRFRYPVLKEDTCTSVLIRIQLRLWSHLRYEGSSPDSMKLLAALLFAREFHSLHS